MKKYNAIRKPIQLLTRSKPTGTSMTANFASCDRHDPNTYASFKIYSKKLKGKYEKYDMYYKTRRGNVYLTTTQSKAYTPKSNDSNNPTTWVANNLKRVVISSKQLKLFPLTNQKC
jgi:hypothetical protein